MSTIPNTCWWKFYRSTHNWVFTTAAHAKLSNPDAGKKKKRLSRTVKEKMIAAAPTVANVKLLLA